MKELLTSQELAEKLKVHLQTVYLYVKDGMPHIRLGRTLRFDFDAVVEWFKLPIVPPSKE